MKLIELPALEKKRVEKTAERLRQEMVDFTDIAPITVNDGKIYFVATQKHLPEEPALFIVDQQMNVYLTNHVYVNKCIMQL